jgi:hypothetical protein
MADKTVRCIKLFKVGLGYSRIKDIFPDGMAGATVNQRINLLFNQRNGEIVKIVADLLVNCSRVHKEAKRASGLKSSMSSLPKTAQS